MLKDLVVNASLYIAAFSMLVRVLPCRITSPYSPLPVRLRIGLLMGVIGAVLMPFGMRLSDEVVFDFRHVVMIMSTLFGGWVATLVTTLLLGIARLAMFPFGPYSLKAVCVVSALGVLYAAIGALMRRTSVDWKFRLMNVIGMTIRTVWFGKISGQARLNDAFLIQMWLIGVIGSIPVYYVTVHLWRARTINAKLLHSKERYRRLALHYQTVVECVREVIFRLDPEGRFTYVNPAWEELTGYANRDTIGQLWLDFIHPEDRSRMDELKRIAEEWSPVGRKRYGASRSG